MVFNNNYTAEETPEEKERKKIRLMSKVEFFAALQEEGRVCFIFQFRNFENICYLLLFFIL